MACDTRMIGSWQEEASPKIRMNVFGKKLYDLIKRTSKWNLGKGAGNVLRQNCDDSREEEGQGSLACCSPWGSKESCPASSPALPDPASALFCPLCAWESDHTGWIIGLPCFLFVLDPWDPLYRNSLEVQVTTTSSCPSVLGLVMAPHSSHTQGPTWSCFSFPTSCPLLCNVFLLFSH